MQFIISSSVLSRSLTSIRGVVSNNPIVPILENLLFVLDGDNLTATASDLNIAMTTKIQVEGVKSGSVAIPAKLLLETLKSLPEQPITIKVDGLTIEVIATNGIYKLSGENAQDFPKTPVLDGGNEISINSTALISAISNTIHATSSDELRPSMNGVNLQINDKQATFAATDGHRLVKYVRKDIHSNLEIAAILNKKALTALKGSFPQKETNVRVKFNNSHACFEFDEIQMIVRLIDERYPDYENAIPVGNLNQLTISRMQIINSLRTISIYANKGTSQIKLVLREDSLQVSAEDLEYSNEATESLKCDYTGDDMEIGFNGKMLIELLSNIQSDEVRFDLDKPNRGVIILPIKQDKSEDLTLLLMPIMLNKF